MNAKMPRVVIVVRETEYELLLARHATHDQAEFFLKTRERKIEDVDLRHLCFEAAMQEARPGAKRLDAIVRNALREDPTALVAWDKACQFGRARVSRRSDAAAATGTVSKATKVPLEVT